MCRGEAEPQRRRCRGGVEGRGQRPVVHVVAGDYSSGGFVNNYDIKVAGYDTAVDQTRVMEAQLGGHFDPTLFAGYPFERVDKMVAPTEATVPVGNPEPRST